MQRQLRQKRTAPRKRAFARAAATAGLASNFGLFRRAERADDRAPGAQAGDISRKVATATGRDVFVVQRGDQVCLTVGGGTACGPVSLATSTPVLLAIERTDGSGATLYGAVSDDVVQVDATSNKGTAKAIRPQNNVYAVDIDGPLQDLSLTHANGAKSNGLIGH